MKIDLAMQRSFAVKSIALMSMMFILLLAFGLGVRGLNADIIWSDELFSRAFMGAFDPPYSPAMLGGSFTFGIGERAASTIDVALVLDRLTTNGY